VYRDDIDQNVPGEMTTIADVLDADAYAAIVARIAESETPIRALVHMWSADLPREIGDSSVQIVDAGRAGCGSVTALAQALIRGGRAFPLCLVTCEAQHLTGDAHPPSATQAALWGLARTLALEHPELQPVIVDVDRDDPQSVDILANELVSGAAEPEMAIRRGMRYVPRLTRVTAETPRALSRVRLEPRPTGVLDDLTLVATPDSAPGAGEVEIQVGATGLNFRDILNALGLYPGEAGPLGDECAGVVNRVGPGVRDLQPGDDVVGIAHGSFASHVVASTNLLVKRPKGLSAVDAATIPIAFLTAEYSLRHVARIGPGDRVLVHAAAGGVGLAAIQIARNAGATVFATAGSAEKHAFLRSLGIEHIFSSRTPDFVDEIRARTDGRGVSVVLNSLTGDFIPRSLDVLASGGRFVEIGRTGIWEPERVRDVRPDVEYTVVFLGDVFRTQPDLSRRMLCDVFSRVERGELTALPASEFTLAAAAAAFRHVAQAKHIGKVVVTQHPVAGRAVSVRPSATYLITGGFGALGLHVARWLVSQGARTLVLVGRRAADAEARVAIRALEERGANVRQVHIDLAEADALDRLRESMTGLPDLGGVVHAAGIVEDGLLLHQDWATFAQVFGPKAGGAHAAGTLAAQRDADFVVLFSSGASVFGSRGQANYAAANAFLDGYVWSLRHRGVRAWSINWGAWAGAGMTASLTERDRERTSAHGHQFITPEEGVAALERLLTIDAHPQVAIMPIDWSRFVQHEPAGRVRPLVSRVIGRASRIEPRRASSEPRLVDRLELAAPRQRRDMVAAHIREIVRGVLGLSGSHVLDEHQGLRDVGLDSLMAVELKNRLQESTGRTLPATLAFDYPTVATLTTFVGALLTNADVAEKEPSPSPQHVIGDVLDLTDEEAEALLTAELAALNKGTGHGV
jgi:NADPH:quinone reductase-like Zn-dependent oxidoreductase/acyl carrier protein